MAGQVIAPETPEHDKLHEVRERSQAIGEFLEWLGERGVSLAVRHQHSDGCREDGFLICDFREDELASFAFQTNQLLAEFFEIDLDTLEAEKTALLDYQRALNARVEPGRVQDSHGQG
jgi:hypothetical protein